MNENLLRALRTLLFEYGEGLILEHLRYLRAQAAAEKASDDAKFGRDTMDKKDKPAKPKPGGGGKRKPGWAKKAGVVEK